MDKGTIVEAHYISGTHWDREWYRPYQEYRMLLVGLIDGLLELMEADAAFRYFQMDGQTCVMEDYLEIRPENRDRLASLIREGRILIGPWHERVRHADVLRVAESGRFQGADLQTAGPDGVRRVRAAALDHGGCPRRGWQTAAGPGRLSCGCEGGRGLSGGLAGGQGTLGGHGPGGIYPARDGACQRAGGGGDGYDGPHSARGRCREVSAPDPRGVPGRFARALDATGVLRGGAAGRQRTAAGAQR